MGPVCGGQGVEGRKRFLLTPPATEEADRSCGQCWGGGQSYQFALRLEVALEYTGFLILFFIVTCFDSIITVQLVLYNGGRGTWDGCECVY